MKLSVYKNYRGTKGVCVTHYKPVKWSGATYTKVSPSFDLMLAYKKGSITKEEYDRRYKQDTLSKLDANEVYDYLKDKVVLTTTNEGIFCFKYTLANWLEEELGVKIEEI